MTAAAHVACALGGVDFVDLDTAWLLADDPYAGGYEAEGARYRDAGHRRARRGGPSRAEAATFAKVHCRAGQGFVRRGHRHGVARP